MNVEEEYDPTPMGTQIVPHRAVKYICDVKGCGFSSKLDEIDPVYVVITKTATLVSCPACVARWLAKHFPKLRAVPIAPRHETDYEASQPLEPLPPVEGHATTKRLFHRRRMNTPRTVKPTEGDQLGEEYPFPDA